MDLRKSWCCQTGLNCRPLHYQWSALPLSYGSMPGIWGIGPDGRPLGGRFLPQGPLWRKHMGRPGKHQNGVKSTPMDRDLRNWAISGPASVPDGVGATESPTSAAGHANGAWGARLRHGRSEPTNVVQRRRGRRVDQGIASGPTMAGDRDNDTGKPGADVKDSRRDRLKLALRENLKRRKAQARGRSDAGPSESADASLDDVGGEKPAS